MVEYYLVDVKSITSKIPRSHFREDDLERFAQSILASGGLLSPILLKQTDLENYEVLAGDLEFYASVRAKELDPRAAEMVNAFIVSPNQEEAAITQIALLSKLNFRQVGSPLSISNLRITNLESRLDSVVQEIKKSQEREIHRLEHEIQKIKNQIPPKIDALEAFNKLNVAELTQKLAIANIRGKTAEKLITAIEQEQAKVDFVSLSDLVKRIKGLGEKRMLSIIDAWNGTY